MPELESTPYRVYYLVSSNSEYFDNIDLTENRTNDYETSISIKAVFGRMNDFNTVKLIVTTWVDSDSSDLYDYYSDNTQYEEYNWNDISEKVISIINDYYSTRDQEYQTIIRYADMIQSLYEDSTSVSFDCSSHGQPRVLALGIPYIRDGEVLSTSIRLTAPSKYQLCISVDDHNPKYKNNSSIRFTVDELREIMKKAEKYDKLRDRVLGIFDDPDYHDRVLASLANPTIHYNPS